MHRLLIALFALAAGLGPVNVVTATAPPTTPPAATTSIQPGTTTTSSGPSTAPSLPDAGTSADEDEWTIRRLVVTGAVVIAALAFIGWAVAKVRNELAKPSAPKP